MSGAKRTICSIFVYSEPIFCGMTAEAITGNAELAEYSEPRAGPQVPPNNSCTRPLSAEASWPEALVK